MFGLHIFFCLFFVDCLLLRSATLLSYCALWFHLVPSPCCFALFIYLDVMPCCVTLMFILFLCLVGFFYYFTLFFTLLHHLTTSPWCFSLLLHLIVLFCCFTLLFCLATFTLLLQHCFVTSLCYYTLLHCLVISPSYILLLLHCATLPYYTLLCRLVLPWLLLCALVCWIGIPLPKFVVQVLEWQTSSFPSLSSIIFSPFFFL